MSRPQKGELIELFVYGTLRTGEPLHDWIAEDIFRKCEATTAGYLYKLRNAEYPAAIFGLDTPNRIHGEVVTVALTDSVVACIEMEQAAGYVCRWVDVTFENGVRAKALSFEFTMMSKDVLGEKIEGGDWVQYLNKQQEEQPEPTEQELEFLSTSLGQMIAGDPELYSEIIEVILEESDQDPEMNDEVAMSDLELMLFNPKYVNELREYMTQAVNNMNESTNEDPE
jgi:gamma-glutamylcyclotransferase (GGCT)/AIG2-like uncharacterized protein YtfP